MFPLDLIRRRLRLFRDKAGAPACGDASGPYGYGRPAHSPDPGARYGFEREQCRTLPVRKDVRWR